MSGKNPFEPIPTSYVEAVPISQIAEGTNATAGEKVTGLGSGKGKNFAPRLGKGKNFAPRLGKGKNFAPRITGKAGLGLGKGKNFASRITGKAGLGLGKGKNFAPRITSKKRGKGKHFASRKTKGKNIGKAHEPPIPLFQPSLTKNDSDTKLHNKSYDMIFDDNLANFSYHFCGSPFFTNELVDKFTVNLKENKTLRKKFEIFMNGIELENRFNFRSQLSGANSATEREAIIEKVASACGDAPVAQYVREFMVFMLSDNGDNTDILILKKNGVIHGVALVSKSYDEYQHPGSFKLELLCSKDLEKGGSFLIMMYLLGLKAKGITTGFLQVAHGYSNLNALCLYDKFGFVEDPDLIDMHNELYMKCDLTYKEDSHIFNTFIASLPPSLIPKEAYDAKGKLIMDRSKNFYKHEPLCTEGFRNLPEHIQEDIIDYRQNCLSSINTEADVLSIRENTLKYIKARKITE
jgi:hypothetical protein